MKTCFSGRYGWLGSLIPVLAVVMGGTAGCSSDSTAAAPKGTGGGGGAGGATGGTGGGASDGAVSDAGGDAHPAETLATFTATGDLEGFAINPYSDVNNLGDATRDGGVLAGLSWDGTQGTPDPGSLKLTAAYSDFGQFVIVQRDFTSVDMRDWTGRRLHISIKVAAGFSVGGAVKVFVQDQIASDGGAPTFPYADQYQAAAAGTDWQDFTFDLAHATYRSADWDDTSSITQIRWFGVNLDAGTAPTDAADGGGVVKPAPATFYIDNVWLE